jgi:hypothetical protein
MAVVLASVRLRLETHKVGVRRYAMPVVIGAVVIVGLLLAVLHGIEATIWAAAYLWWGALVSPIDAMLYSLDAMTTRGASGLMLQQRHWRIIGAQKRPTACYFSVSARPSFAMMHAYWPMLSPPSELTSRQESSLASRRKS